MKALSTKSLSAELVGTAQKSDLDIQCVDFIKTTPVSFKIESLQHVIFDSIVFTSANAVKYFFENSESKLIVAKKRIFALEGKTASTLNDAGITIFAKSHHSANLAEIIINTGQAHGVLHVCGNLKLNILQAKLTAANIGYAPLVVYETVLLNHIRIKDKFDAIMFYSPSGVDSFLHHNSLEPSTLCCCIGDTTAIALKRKVQYAKVIIPPTPLPEAMIESMLMYFEKTSD